MRPLLLLAAAALALLLCLDVHCWTCCGIGGALVALGTALVVLARAGRRRGRG